MTLTFLYWRLNIPRLSITWGEVCGSLLRFRLRFRLRARRQDFDDVSGEPWILSSSPKLPSPEALPVTHFVTAGRGCLEAWSIAVRAPAASGKRGSAVRAACKDRRARSGRL